MVRETVLVCMGYGKFFSRIGTALEPLTPKRAELVVITE